MSEAVPIPEWVYEAAWLARPHFKINRSDPKRPDVAARAHGIRMVDAAAPHIDRLARIDELHGLIRAFVIKEEFHKAFDHHQRVAGIRECITHLQNLIEAYGPEKGEQDG